MAYDTRGSGNGKYDEPPSKKKGYQGLDGRPLIRDGLESEDSIISTVNRIWRHGREKMYPYMRQWLTNLRFFMGDQWTDLREDRYSWYVPDPLPCRARLTANIVQKHVMAWVSRMTRNKPRHEVFPVNEEISGKDRADVVNSLIAHQYHQIKFGRELVRTVKIAGIMGCCYLKSYYDELEGPLVHPLQEYMAGDDDLFGEYPEMAEERGIDREMLGAGRNYDQMKPKGQVMGVAIPPYEVTPAGDWPRSMRECKRVLHSRFIPIEEVKERFHDHPEIHQLEPGFRSEEEYRLWFIRDAVRGALRYLVSSSTDERGDETATDSDHSILVHELWGTRTGMRPKGVLAIVCGNLLLWPRDSSKIENPYYHNEIPLVRVDHTTSEIEFFPTCDLEQAIPVQKEYNDRISKLIDSANLTSNPERRIDQGHGEDLDEKTGAPGEIWEVTRGTQFEYLSPPNIPMYLFNLLNEFRYIIQEIFSDHKPSQGVSQRGDSGIKVARLQAADQARFTSFAEELGSSLEEFWLQQICLMAQYAKGKEVGYLLGRRKERMYFTWTRNDLIDDKWANLDERGQVYMLKSGFDLKMLVVPAKTPETVARDIDFLLARGVLHPQEDKATIVEMLGYGFEADSMLIERRLHESEAAQENDAFARGSDMPYPGVYERWDIHLVTHKQFTSTDRFKGLAPERQQLFNLHIAETERAMFREPLRMEYLRQAVTMEMAKQFGPLMMVPGAQQGGNGQNGKERGQAVGPQSSEPRSGSGRPNRPDSRTGGSVPPAGYRQRPSSGLFVPA